MPEVKFCGLMRDDDVRAAIDIGATYIGFVLATGKRQLSSDDAARLAALASSYDGKVRRVAVFGHHRVRDVLDATRRIPVDVVQLHAPDNSAYVAEIRENFAGEVWVVARVGAAGLGEQDRELFLKGHGVLLDALSRSGLGGTGESFDWAAVAPQVRAARERGHGRLIVAGGLSPDNVGRVIELLDPDVVDVSSGVETTPGLKDHSRMRDFISAVRAVPGKGASGERGWPVGQRGS